MACKFVSELSKLRKLSMESVENTASFDAFKKYLHVLRPVESDLRNLLSKVNAVNKKTLVLLCGSAGDGKSHLISYLRNADDAHLLDAFELYNDATESSAPLLTSIDTLAEKLAPFNDENCGNDDGFKMILAINLGTLNNFIESEKGKSFSELKKYVEAYDIFSADIRPNAYHPNSVFQHVSFSDYQVFTLNSNGIGTAYLEELFEKVFRQTDENPFYKAFCANNSCTLCQKCPVRHNFEFMLDTAHQKAVINKIVEVVIKDKAIVSTREILNLIYDLLVHPDFDYNAMCKAATNEIKYLTKYIQCTIPMLMYEFDDISPLVNTIRRHDRLKDRQAEMDADMTRFHSLENIYEYFTEATQGTPFAKLNDTTQIAILGGIKSELKKLVYRFIVRIRDLKGEFPGTAQNRLFDEYVQYLYWQHSGNEMELLQLYDATQNAVLSWDGQFDSDTICIDDSNNRFWVLEQLQIEPLPYMRDPEDGEVLRFSTTLKLRFRKENCDIDTAEISVDYALFEMISAMREGYRPTVQDKNQHTDFVSFVQRLIEFGNKATRIILIPKDGDQNTRYIFEKKAFGYSFKVV